MGVREAKPSITVNLSVVAVGRNKIEKHTKDLSSGAEGNAAAVGPRGTLQQWGRGERCKMTLGDFLFYFFLRNSVALWVAKELKKRTSDSREIFLSSGI